MEDFFVGSIFAFGFDDRNLQGKWIKCDGRLLPISGYETLFTLIQNNFGGDGMTTFGVPDLRGRVPVGTGDSYYLGTTGGNEQVTLRPDNLPPHTHSAKVGKMPVADRDTLTTANVPTDGYLSPGKDVGAAFVRAGDKPTLSKMGPNTKSTKSTGNGNPVNIMNPYQTVGYYICVDGVFPPRPR